ncbi:MAG: SEL1-like repeat protein [Chryseobacterium sp.]|nr:SEL1-like repeat protein [Candidatus Chryseobacterium enterohippi]
MAHRVYIYNFDSSSGNIYEDLLGEWNYEIPMLLLPLFGSNTKSKGKKIYADRIEGIAFLRNFYYLLEKEYNLSNNSKFKLATSTFFSVLENLPYDQFLINATDVFHMNIEKHSDQAKEWVFEIQNQMNLYNKAIAEQSLYPLKHICKLSGYDSFLKNLEEEWVDYGLGYWEEDVLQLRVKIFKENNLKGLKDISNTIILSPIYNEIYAFEKNIAVIEKEGKFGYLSNDGIEMVPPIYDDAFDVFEISDFDNNKFDERVGIISNNNKLGLYHFEDKEITIPTIYDELELLGNHYFNAKLNDDYIVIDYKNRRVIDIENNQPFELEHPSIFLIKIEGSSKSKYYTAKGNYLGDYIRNVLYYLTNDYYYVEANKWQRKIEIIKPDGTLLDTEIDKKIHIYNNTTIAYKKGSRWFLYDLENHNYVLTDCSILAVELDSFVDYFSDSYIIYTEDGWGIFDAKNENWLIKPDLKIKSISHLEHKLLRIELSNSYIFWDGSSQTSSLEYDYISESLDRDKYQLVLYKNNELFGLDQDNNVVNVEHSEIGSWAHYNNLRGKDLQIFTNFYKDWKNKQGPKYYRNYDDKLLYRLGMDLAQENKIDEAIEVFKIGVSRNDALMMTELAIIYSNPEEKEHHNLSLANELYLKAAALDEKNAWNNLGYHYQNGYGFTKDIDKAIEAYTRAGNLGNGLGWTNLGDLYYYGNHVKKDFTLATKYYLKAEKHFNYNYEKLAYIYYANEEFDKVTRLIQKDKFENYAQIYFGLMHDQGLGGIKMVKRKAISYYEKALQQDIYPHAVRRLLFFYKKESEFYNEYKYKYWKNFAIENNLEIDLNNK